MVYNDINPHAAGGYDNDNNKVGGSSVIDMAHIDNYPKQYSLL